MTLIVYGISNCDKCRAARKWLEAEGIDHRFHDFRKDGLSAAQAAAWLDMLGSDVLVNRRGTTWRNLPDDQKARLDNDASGLLEEQPTLIKRPVFVAADQVQIGFTDAVKLKLRERG